MSVPVVKDEGNGRISFKCPGCGHDHTVMTGEGAGPRWGFNGDLACPTFTPSILYTSGHHCVHHDGGECWCTWEDREEFPDLNCVLCHSFVTDGKIQFLSDCSHAMAGHTIDLPVIS